jgi:alanine racemase
MIVGHGIDAQEIEAVTRLVARRPQFVDVILTAAERAVYEQRRGKHQMEFLAGRFSVKEAYSKALGTGIGSEAHWHDIEVLPNEQGQPVMIKHPKQDEYIAHISISHSGDYVHSSVILEDKASFNQPVSYMRPAWLEISQAALAHNINLVRERTQTERFFAIVKANAYGHGLVQIVTAALQAGVDGFGVATIDEAIWLRQFGVTEPILILGITAPTFAHELAKFDLLPIVPSLDWLTEAVTYLEAADHLRLSIGVDTGMGRIGIRDRTELERVIGMIADDNQLQLQAIGMHFATADGTNVAYFEQQLSRWHELTDDLPIGPDVWRHLANSGTALWHDQPSRDLVRVGAAMYGFDASSGELPDPELAPVLSLKADLVHVKQVPAGESISYGATYTTDKPTWIATVPVGYADGYPRSLQGMTVLLPDGQRAQVVGRVAMDQFMIALPQAYPVGTTVTLLGKVADEQITLVDWADFAGSIPYEMATNLAARLPRRLVD